MYLQEGMGGTCHAKLSPLKRWSSRHYRGHYVQPKSFLTVLNCTGKGRNHLNHKKPAAIKLRHLAQATSPPGLATRYSAIKPPEPVTSLIVSIPLSTLRATNDLVGNGTNQRSFRREVALSSFVSKKRASSRSSSTSSEGSTFTTSKMPKKMRPRNRGRERSGKVAPKRTNRAVAGNKLTSSRPSAMSEAAAMRKDVISVGIDVLVSRDEHSPMDQETEGSKSVLSTVNSNSNNRTHANSNVQRDAVASRVSIYAQQDDDQISIASSSTNSTNSTSNGSRGSRTRSRPACRSSKNHVDATGPRATICLEELFSYYPPRLVIKDGDLHPEQSLSAKNLDRHSVPESHPLLKWTLGQPVKGVTAVKKKRKTQKPVNGYS